jgi:hypothetical protein
MCRISCVIAESIVSFSALTDNITAVALVLLAYIDSWDDL